MITDVKKEKRDRRKAHIRLRVTGTPERPRLSVYKSLKHIYAQVVDDTTGATLAYASSLEGEVAGGKGKKEAAKKVGGIVAKRCRDKQIEKVVFDRNGFDYHGRVAAVAEGARAAGLKF
ncbi:MAG TPA: 50S ribosomal protein L18 [Myxococcales bacterium]|nr:50S ribosomal protein L18 [Myxococcales bacterium]